MKKLKSKPYLCIWLVSLFISLIYLTLAFNNSIWTDEAYTLWIIKGNFKEIVTTTSFDVHPPLYYFLSKLFSIVFPINSISLLSQKLLPILSFFLTYGFAGSWLWKRGFGAKAIFFFDLCLFSIPCTMEYALQLRMYSWGMFFVTMSGILAYDCYAINKKICWIGLTISAACAAYTHNFALVSVFFVYVLLGFALLISNRKRIISWLLSGLGVLVLYAPWLLILLRQFTNVTGTDYWIQPITKKTLISYLEWTFGNNFKYVYVGVTFIFVLLGVYSLVKIYKYRLKEDIFCQFCWMIPFLTMAFGVAVSILKTPVYYNRYVFCALGILFVGVGITLRDVDMKKPIIPAIVLLFLLIGAEQYRETYIQEYISNGAAEFTKYVKNNIGDKKVLYNFDAVGIIYEYYLGDNLCYYEKEDFSEKEDEWYYMYTPGMPSFNDEILEENGIKSEYIKDFYIEEASFDLVRLYRSTK